MTALLSNPWTLGWLITGAVCSTGTAITVYNHGFFVHNRDESVWTDAVARTVHAMTILLVIAVTIAAWPVVVVLLLINVVLAWREAAPTDDERNYDGS